MGLASQAGLLCAQCSFWLYKGAALTWLTEDGMQGGQGHSCPYQASFPIPLFHPWDTHSLAPQISGFPRPACLHILP